LAGGDPMKGSGASVGPPFKSGETVGKRLGYGKERRKPTCATNSPSFRPKSEKLGGLGKE